MKVPYDVVLPQVNVLGSTMAYREAGNREALFLHGNPTFVEMPDRTAEFRWIAEHLQEYAGQWVALHGDRLLSHSTDAREVFATAPLRKNQLRDASCNTHQQGARPYSKKELTSEVYCLSGTDHDQRGAARQVEVAHVGLMQAR